MLKGFRGCLAKFLSKVMSALNSNQVVWGIGNSGALQRLRLSALQTKQAQFPEAFITGHLLQPTAHFHCPLLTSEISLLVAGILESRLPIISHGDFLAVFKEATQKAEASLQLSLFNDIPDTWQKWELPVPKQQRNKFAGCHSYLFQAQDLSCSYPLVCA